MVVHVTLQFEYQFIYFFFFSEFVIFCLVAKVIYTKYELTIKAYLYYRGFTFVKNEDLNYVKDFDAFFSFSHDDDEFVIKDIISGKLVHKSSRTNEKKICTYM